MGYYRDSMHQRQALSDEAAKLTGGPMPIPMLYFHGRNDGCLGIDLVDEGALKDSLGPGGEYVFVQGAGHFMHLEKPDEVNPKVIEFLRS
jgi:pimeloyl-ACP methyl ester carboxylesterase